MQSNIYNTIIENIKQFNKKKVILKQLGFLESKFVFEIFCYSLNNDILIIKDEKNDVFIKININEIYNLEMTEKAILIYMDNDTKIKLEDKK